MDFDQDADLDLAESDQARADCFSYVPGAYAQAAATTPSRPEAGELWVHADASGLGVSDAWAIEWGSLTPDAGGTVDVTLDYTWDIQNPGFGNYINHYVGFYAGPGFQPPEGQMLYVHDGWTLGQLTVVPYLGTFFVLGKHFEVGSGTDTTTWSIDLDGGESYMWFSAIHSDPGVGIPEPATALLVLAGYCVCRRRGGRSAAAR